VTIGLYYLEYSSPSGEKGSVDDVIIEPGVPVEGNGNGTMTGIYVFAISFANSNNFSHD
jgi:hypothetical protein